MSSSSDTPSDTLDELAFELDLTCFQRILHTIAALQLEYESMRPREFSGQSQASRPVVEQAPGADFLIQSSKGDV